MLNDIFKSKLRQKLLKYWLKYPKKDFYVRELAQAIKEDAGNCSRELKNLQKAGLITAGSRGNLKLYSLKQDHPDLPKIRELFLLAEPRRETKTVYFIAGPNGSGKSTVAEALIRENNLPFLNADEIAAKISPKDFSKVRLQAGKLFLGNLRKYIREKQSFVVETTFAGVYWRKWIKILKQKNYVLYTIFIFVASGQEAVLRIRVRIKKGGHPVPEEEIHRRFQRSKTNFWNLYRKEMDHWQIHLNSKDELTPVAFGAGEEMQVMNQRAFHLFKEGIA